MKKALPTTGRMMLIIYVVICPTAIFAFSRSSILPTRTGWIQRGGVDLRLSSREEVATTTASNDNSAEERDWPPPIIPITVLSGFLGAGKTTLIQDLLEKNNNNGLNVAVIVNDMASINIDSQLVQRGNQLFGGNTNLASSAQSNILQLQNGCACCSLSGELLSSVQELVTLSDLRQMAGSEHLDEEEYAPPFDHILVEMSGISEPASVRGLFQQAQMLDNPLMERVQLDTMITVLDASTFLMHLYSSKEATPQAAPELFSAQDASSQPDWTQELPPKLKAALQAGMGQYTLDASAGVADLIIQQTECADIVLINKCDLVDEQTLDTIEDVVKELNPKATTLRTTKAQVENASSTLLGAAGGEGVALSGVVDDLKDSVEAALVETSHDHSHGHDEACDDPTCQDSSHDHSHSHDHACVDPSCQDSSHDHSHHSHSHDHDCADPLCQDPAHSHSHASASTKGHDAIGSLVYRARRPFHSDRLWKVLQHFPISKTGSPPETSSQSNNPFQSVLRSKGFTWIANSHFAALFWSHAGITLEIQCLGRWWATLSQTVWPSEDIDWILKDFDSDPQLVGDRRQELVLIGPGLKDLAKQAAISEALDSCLLTNDEWQRYQDLVLEQDSTSSSTEAKLVEEFGALPIEIEMKSY